MKKIRINNFKEHLYYEKLENGLSIYLVPLPYKNNYTCMFLTKYGGRDIKFKVDGELKQVPTGIAHFLEHKLFEREEDPFAFYQKYGTDVNASTSHDFTSYYIHGSKNYKQNLTYLLNWLSKLEITEDLVKKEQGIILEEANMYKDVPDRVLLNKIKENVFLNDPYRNKVIGKDEDIISITKEELELCYESFYNPENMVLISVGNFNPKQALEIIKESTNKFKKNTKKIEKYYEKESDEVHKKYEEIYLNVDAPRLAVAYKINKEKINKLKMHPLEKDIYIHTLLSIGLGTTSEIREKWLKEKLFVTLTYRLIEIETHYVIEFTAVTNSPDELEKELDLYLKDIKIDKESFERQKKMWISSEIKTISNINSIQYAILDDILDYGEFIPNKIEIIKQLNYENLEKTKELFSFDNKVTVKVLKNEKNIVNQEKNK